MTGENPVIVHQPSGNPVVVATGVVDALKAQPTLLVVVLLNCVMVAGACFFLLRLEEYRHLERLELFKLIDSRGLGDPRHPTPGNLNWARGGGPS